MAGRVSAMTSVWTKARLTVVLCVLAGICMGRADQAAATEKPAAATQAIGMGGHIIIKEYFGHHWKDELIHFDLKDDVPGELELAVNGRPTPCQIVTQNGRRQLWAVVSLEPGKTLSLELRSASGKRDTEAGVSVKHEGEHVILENDRLGIRLPRLSGQSFAAPLDGVRRAGGAWLGRMSWANLNIKSATTEIVEQGPVLARVKQRYRMAEGDYTMTVQLAARQDAATIWEEGNLKGGPGALRFDVKPGLEPTHVYWHSAYGVRIARGRHTRQNMGISAGPIYLMPWSFWWLPDVNAWAGFYREGGDFLGVVFVKPSEWLPLGWVGFEQTRAVIQNGVIEMPVAPEAGPLKRRWVQTAYEFRREEAPLESEKNPRIRFQLIKYGEMPLDEVKDYIFEWKEPRDLTRPFVLMRAEDIDAIRRSARSPAIAAQLRKFQGHRGPTLWLATGNRSYGQALADEVKRETQHQIDLWLENPQKPGRSSAGSYSFTVTSDINRLALCYDLLGDTDLLSPEEKARARAALALANYSISSSNYWDAEIGTASGNPNMTTSIYLTRGIVALALAGHPMQSEWLGFAERQMVKDLKSICPGGAWIECPGYGLVSLDRIFLLAQGIKNAIGRDYFKDENFRDTLTYYGYLLTPPDRRFPPTNGQASDKLEGAPCVLPSIGDGMSGALCSINAWMARATAEDDPEYSAEQQFFWKAQNSFLEYMSRATESEGFTLAVVDSNLPARPPAVTDRGFPGFGATLRSSWTDPRAAYLCHRTGPNYCHYHDDYNSIVFYAKGAPLCIDFGNMYEPVQRGEPEYHNRVSGVKGRGELVEVRSLSHTLGYSHGRSQEGSYDRHVLLVKSADPMGANYVLVRDETGGQPTQFNLWCLSKSPPMFDGSVARFKGQFGVDLDVHVLSPSAPRFTTAHWSWAHHIYVWGQFAESQHAVRVRSNQDYFTVLYPRAEGQAPAEISMLADGKAISVKHCEGTDWIIFSPGQETSVSQDGVSLRGEITFARKSNDGSIRLAVLKGEGASARMSGCALTSSGQSAVEIKGNAVRGEANGKAHTIALALPQSIAPSRFLIDGEPVETVKGNTITLKLTDGYHTFNASQADLPVP